MNFFIFIIILANIYAQPISVSGTVKDGNGQPLVGANVFIEGTTLGVATDASGKYRIRKVPKIETINYLLCTLVIERRQSLLQLLKVLM